MKSEVVAMFSVEKAPQYLRETEAAVARLQELSSADRYGALVARAERLLEGMFTVETDVDPDVQVRIALRERFDAARVKQAILMVATWQLVAGLTRAWSLRREPAPAAARRALAAV